MAACRNCGKGGWLTAVDANGLCDQCQAIVLPQILNHCRIVLESVQIIQSSRNAATRLSRIEVATRNCHSLVASADKGIPTISEHPRDVARELARLRGDIIEQAIQDQVFAARQKAKDAATDAGKLGGYAKAVDVLTKLMDETSDVAPLEAAVVALRAERDCLKFDQLAKRAETALAKGRTKQAIEIYIEAMMSLRHDTTPDHWQTEREEHARARITQLGGVAPY